jgi:hypothetical protein
MISISWIVSGVSINSLDYGSSASSSYTSTQTVSISHNGNNQITNCRLYIGPSSDYQGDYLPAGDISELLKWGDNTTVAGFGGLELNMNALGSFPSGNWSTCSGKSSSSYNVFRTGVGDSSTSGILLYSGMNSTPAMSANGIIPPNCSVWPSMETRVSIPSSGVQVGTRDFELRATFSFTS